MNTQTIGKTRVQASRLVLGCMRMDKLDKNESQKVLATALDLGIDFFDHADIYGGGLSEEHFGQALKELAIPRDQLLLQSKCGIRQGAFDFSKEHILTSVEGSLKRLQTDYLDFLVLHRPDALVEPEEVAEAFFQLRKSGKVRHFGVSNQNPHQMALLSHYLDQPLAVNQVQLSPAHTPMIDAGLNVNMLNPAGQNRDSGIIDYCRLQEITLQAWSPFLIDLSQGIFMGHPDYQELTETILDLADHYQVSSEAIIVAWILRHPARMQCIVGSMNPTRLTHIAQANSITLTRDDWYRIYISAGNRLP